MENILHIGAKVDKDSADNLANSLSTVFTSAFNNHISDANIGKAIDLFARTFEGKQVTIESCSFVGEDKSVTVNTVEEK